MGKKSCLVTIRVNEIEMEKLKEFARYNHVTVAKYLLNCSIYKDIIPFKMVNPSWEIENDES